MTKDEQIAKLREALEMAEPRLDRASRLYRENSANGMGFRAAVNSVREALSLPSSSDAAPPVVSITDEMVERAARAIASQYGRAPDKIVKSCSQDTIYHLHVKGRTSASVPYFTEHAAWTEYKLYARAALQAALGTTP